MPRHPDIGWQHGKMIGGHRHHVQCNYCHRVMIGGITRFKKHLAGKSGEVKGCEAAPKEVRETIKRHFATLKANRAPPPPEATSAPPPPTSGSTDMDSNAFDSDEADARHELVDIREAEMHSLRSFEQQSLGGTREFFNAFPSVSDNEEQCLAPPRATDLGWAHGLMVNGDRQKIKCRYCRKVILGGGISRLKQHLAGERGNIAPCEKVPGDVKAEMQQHLGFKVLEKLNKQKESEVVKNSVQHNKGKGYDSDIPISNFAQGRNGKRRGKGVNKETSAKRRGKKPSIPQTSQVAQFVSHCTLASQESIDQADVSVARFMCHAGIPFKEVNSLYFQQMADAIAAVGPGYKIPSYHTLQGGLLHKCALEVGENCKELRKSWEVTGCTVMVDRWIDKTGQSMIDFFVYCPKGTMFLKSVDVFDIENSLDDLVNLFESIIEEVGPNNVVCFLTDRTPRYKAAARVLFDKYKTFFCSVCAINGIEFILSGIGKIDEVKEILAKAKKICQLVYNNAWVLSLMRKETEGREIFQPSETEFVTKFLTLQNIISLKDCLHQMFTSSIWEQSVFAKQRLGINVIGFLSDPHFWLSCTKIMKAVKPLIAVLQMADSKERPSIGYLYEAMEKAKRAISSAFENREYLPYLEVINEAQEEFHSPLLAVAYYLNPAVFYNPNFSITSAIQKGLLDCIETLEPNTTAQDNITRDKAFYEDSIGDFSRPVAVRGRESLTPATWWSLYASDYPDLQRFAVRILSQTCSITAYNRKTTGIDCTYSSKNRLEQQRLDKLSFVHYNLRLQKNRRSLAAGNKALTRGEYDLLCLEGKNVDIDDMVEDPGVLEVDSISGLDRDLSNSVILVRKINQNLGINDGARNDSYRSDDSLDS